MRVGTLSTWTATGAAVGLSLSLAEVCIGYLAGGRFPMAWWGFLALYYVPSLAVAGALLGLARRSMGARVFPAEAARLTVDALFFVYLVVAANHEYLKGVSSLALARVATVLLGAALAWLHSWRLSRALTPLAADARGALTFQLARPLLLVGAAWGATSAARLEERTTASLGFLVLAYAAADLATSALARLWLAGAVHRRLAVTAVGAFVALVCGRGLATAPSGTLREEPLPPLAEAPSRLEGRPNIVMILLDTVGAADLSAYASPPAATPRLDAFARQAVVYGRCLSPSPWSLPAHASLFTGLFPPQHGAGFDPAAPPCRPRGLAPRFETLAQALGRQGYATAAIVANQPTFDPVFGLDRGFRHLDARLPRERVDLRFAPLLVRLEGRLPLGVLSDQRVRWFGVAWRPAEDLVRDALAWLERRPATRPYFLFLNFMDAHTPFPAHTGNRELRRSPRLPLYGRPDGRWAEPLDAEESRHLRALRAAAILYLDGQLGRLLDSLQRRPEWAATWVVITSDHGESVSEGRMFGHNCATLSQEVLHVPLIVRDPRALASAGSRDLRPVQLVDLAPMLLSAAGLEPPSGPGGLPIGTRRTLLALSQCNCPRLQPGAQRGPADAIVEDECKYVRIGDAPEQLFDLAKDPGEARNLAADQPERLEQLRASLERWKRQLVPPPEARGRAEDGRSDEALRALGYLR